MNEQHFTVSGFVLEEETDLTLADLSRACCVHAEWIIALVDEGILEPRGKGIVNWRFSGDNLKRAMAAQRLQHDLGINLPGTALALELLEEIETLRTRLQSLSDRHE